MEKIDTTWRIFVGYMLVIFFMLLANSAFAQIEVTQFNAGWNNANDVPWVQKLSDCKTIGYTDIGTNKEAQKEYKIAVITPPHSNILFFIFIAYINKIII